MADQNEEILQPQEDVDIVELQTEDGGVVPMRIMTIIEHNGQSYAAMVAEEVFQSDAEEADVVFMQVMDQEGDTDESWLQPVEDEDLLDELFDGFLQWAEEDEED